MLTAVLVANRSEIALRVFRACRDLGVRAVGVYSEADRFAPWLDGADETYLLGPTPAAESYLSIARVLDVAERAGVDAIHPGYGFLSENGGFAQAVIDAGLTWIGPPPDAITVMGDKLSARGAAERAGVAVVPGTAEPVERAEQVRAFADEHGLPLALKAAFGGGGRGLRVVRDISEIDDAFEASQREAVASFGRGEVYLERYLDRPRHVEAQILADQHGHCLFLGERDCSTQRRHQKLIEETPAPHLDPDLRRAIGEAAVAVSEHVGYVGAGTVEFLVEADDLYFLEMNTRLQVEHPVTELVTGIDLVHAQLRVAAGEALPWEQDEIAVRGHAIEARINAEDVGAGFVPAPGKITRWRTPSGPGVRLDAGVAEGWTVPNAYDSLLAKLVVWGADRDEARRKLVRACNEFVVEGVPTTLDFHRFALTHPDFVAGRVSTISVEREWQLDEIAPAAPTEPGDPPAAPSQVVTVEVDGRRVEVAVFEPDQAPPRRRRATGRGRAAGSAGTVTAPMQGTIVKIGVAEGKEVTRGDLVVVLEAMKMENHVRAALTGRVASVHVEQGDTVNTGDALVTLEPAEDPA